MGEMEENGSLTRRGRGEDKHNNEKRGGANPRLKMKRQRHASPPPQCYYRAICVHYSSMPTPHLKKTHGSHKNSNTAAASSPTFCGTSGKAGIYLLEEREEMLQRENALKKEEEEE